MKFSFIFLSTKTSFPQNKSSTFFSESGARSTGLKGTVKNLIKEYSWYVVDANMSVDKVSWPQMISIPKLPPPLKQPTNVISARWRTHTSLTNQNKLTLDILFNTDENTTIYTNFFVENDTLTLKRAKELESLSTKTRWVGPAIVLSKWVIRLAHQKTTSTILKPKFKLMMLRWSRRKPEKWIEYDCPFDCEKVRIVPGFDGKTLFSIDLSKKEIYKFEIDKFSWTLLTNEITKLISEQYVEMSAQCWSNHGLVLLTNTKMLLIMDHSLNLIETGIVLDESVKFIYQHQMDNSQSICFIVCEQEIVYGFDPKTFGPLIRMDLSEQSIETLFTIELFFPSRSSTFEVIANTPRLDRQFENTSVTRPITDQDQQWLDLIKNLNHDDLRSGGLLDLVVHLGTPKILWKIPPRFAPNFNFTSQTPYQSIPKDSPLWDEAICMLHRTWVHPFSSQRMSSYSPKNIILINNPLLESIFDSTVLKLEKRLEKDPDLFIPAISDGSERWMVMSRFKACCQRNTGLKKCNLLFAWHGCSVEVARKIAMTGVADLRRFDGGWFGAGVYLTPEASYALMYSGTENKKCIVGCWVIVGSCYPVTRTHDYDNAEDFSEKSISKFHPSYPNPKLRNDKALEKGFDAHFASVSSDVEFHSSRNPQFDELILKQEVQVLPRYIVILEPADTRHLSLTPRGLSDLVFE
jgi:hypothetical protein